jgi:hypothetical protein
MPPRTLEPRSSPPPPSTPALNLVVR